MSKPHKSVTVSLDGDAFLTIETNCLSGGDIGEREEEAIRWAIDHLSAFIADKRDADAIAAAHLAGRIEQAREDAKILAEQLAEATRPDQRMTLAIAIRAIERGRNLTDTEKMKNLMAALAEFDREEAACDGKDGR